MINRTMLVRTIVGVLIFAVLLAALINEYVFTAVFSVAFVLAINEIDLTFKQKQLKVFILPSYIFAGTFAPAFLLIKTFGNPNIATPLLLSYSMLLFVVTICGQVVKGRKDCNSAIYCLVPIAYPLASACALVFMYFGLKSRIMGIMATAMALLAPLASDMFAYFGGVFFGKHKLCPEISPKKTVEGSICGIFGGIALGAVLYAIQGWFNGDAAWHTMLVIGMLCGIVGQLGDLFASSIKRWAGLKDFSTLLPGHGGIMDRLDSVWLCAPVILCFLLAVGN